VLFKNARVVRFVPDQQGKGGAKTQIHSHQAGPLLDTYDVFNASVFYGRWRKEAASYAIPNTTDDAIPQAQNVGEAANGSNIFFWGSGPMWDVTQVGYQVTIDDGVNQLVTTITGVNGGSSTPYSYDETSITTLAVWPYPSDLTTTITVEQLPFTSYVVHPFYKFSTTDPSANATINILGHNSDALQRAHRIWNYTGAGALLKFTGNPCVPATFLNIKNRCHICWGGTDNFIFDGTNVYDSGVVGPATAPTYTFDATKTFAVNAYATKGSAVITEAAPTGTPGNAAHKFGTGAGLVGKTITLPNLAGTGTDNYVVVANSTVNFNPAATATGTIGSNQVILAGVVLAPNIYNGCFVTTTGGVNTNIPIASYFTPTNTTSTVLTLQGPLAATGAPFATLNLFGYQLTLNLAYAGLTAWSAPTNGNTGNLSWTGNGPRYAYAYYDPITGHISNISPYVQVTETNQSDVGIVLHDIPTTGDTRFTSIVIFRTILENGSYLLQLTVEPPGGAEPPPRNLANTGGPLTFTDGWADSYLLNVGALQGPYLTNNKPPPFSTMVYWDGRIFGAPVNDPSAVRYSADNVQVTFGVPEECFPSRNVLRIPAADGRITGMKLIGNQAVIMTERWAYTVVGNNETNYRLIRFSTHMMGVGSYQITEFTGDTSENSDAVVYLGKDQKVYMLAPGLGNIALSAPIQDKLAASLPDLARYKVSRVHTATIEGRKLVFARTEDDLLQYDYDRKVWTRMRSDLSQGGLQVIPDAFASLYGSTNPVDEIWVSAGALRGWLRYSPATGAALANCWLKTFPLTFVDDEKKRKQLNFVRMYVSNVPTDWPVTIYVDEVPSVTVPSVQSIDPAYRIYPTGAVPIEGPDVAEAYAFPTGGTTIQTQPYGGTVVAAPLVGYRFLIKIEMTPNGLDTADLFAFDVCYSDVQEQEGVSL